MVDCDSYVFCLPMLANIVQLDTNTTRPLHQSRSIYHLECGYEYRDRCCYPDNAHPNYLGLTDSAA